MPRTIVQPGSSAPRDLFVFAHIEGSYIRAQAARVTNDCVVSELEGAGTSAYKGLVARYGGWRGMVKGIETKLSTTIRRACLTTWSAGSQTAKEACLAPESEWPDALVMLDGLYGGKPVGAKMGDGKVNVDDGLRAIARFAASAARGERHCVILHSRIQTTYASSKECAEAVQKLVEEELGQPLELDPEAMKLGRPYVEAWMLGQLHIVEYKGADAAEHIAQAHLFDEVWSTWIPWTKDEDSPTTDPTPAATTVGALALELSLGELRAGVREHPPGSNKVKGEYWAGCTRIIAGKEQLVHVNQGPWCAAAFQWATYEAARRLKAPGVGDPGVWRGDTSAIPHGRRVSVQELQADMTLRGRFRSKGLVLSGGYEPQPGDAVFLSRAENGASSAATSGLGHIARFVRRLDAETFETIGGNELAGAGDSDRGDTWRLTRRRFDEPRLRGFGAFGDVQPSFGAAAAPTEGAELAHAAALTVDAAFRSWVDEWKSAYELVLGLVRPT